MDQLIKLDVSLFKLINQHGNNAWDPFMLFATGKFTWLPFYVILLLVVIYKYRVDTWKFLIMVVLSILIADQISSSFLKPMVMRLRPCHDLNLVNQIRLVVDSCGGQYGFVSSHAANSFSIMILVSRAFNNRKALVIMAVWASIVSYSRIYIGVHYPLDVICGGILGVLSGLLVWNVSNKVKWLRLHQ